MAVVTAAGGSLPPHRRGRTEGGKHGAAAREAAVADVLRRCADAGRQRALCKQLPGSRASQAARRPPCHKQEAAQNTRQCSGVSSVIEQSGGYDSFGGSRAHIVSAGQSAQPLGGFFGIAASTCYS